jgi:hypothetical protein
MNGPPSLPPNLFKAALADGRSAKLAEEFHRQVAQLKGRGVLGNDRVPLSLNEAAERIRIVEETPWPV